jgi:glycosyltransferase involved in cell wall biosynthesis
LILFVTGEYPPDVGGVADYTARLNSELTKVGCETAVFSRRDAQRWDARALAALIRRAPRQGVVHIQYQAAAFDLLGDMCLLPLMLRPRRAVRVVTTFHDTRAPYLFPKAGRLRSMAIRLLARTSHAVVAADERDLATLGAGRSYQVPIGSNVACDPPTGFSRAEFRTQLGLATDDLALVYFGLLNSSKGLDTLLDAFELLPEARLLLLGGSVGASDATNRVTTAAVERRVAAFGARVIRPGYQAASSLSAHLLAADIAVLPYVDGASPRRGSLLACAEHGLPIVSTAPVSQAVADAVLAVPPGDAGALAQAARSVARSTELQTRLRAGSAALAGRSSWSAIAQQHVAIYREVGWPSR